MYFKNTLKVCRVIAALLLLNKADAAPFGDVGSVINTLKCISSTAYSGPYMVASVLPPNPNSDLHGKFIHITDIHIDELYRQNSDPKTQCHRAAADPSKNVAGKYGTLGSICATPKALLDKTFAWMGENTNDVDFILYTGDSARHDRDTLVPRQHSEVYSEHQLVVDAVSSAFDISKVKFIPTFGNNDQEDYNAMIPTNDPVIANLTKIWEPLGLGLETNQEWLTAGYFAYEVKPGLVVLNLNSMMVLATNKLTSDCSVSGSGGAIMLSWFADQLALARQQQKKVYVMQHVPPTNQLGAALYYPGCQSQYTDIIGGNADVILGSYYGHTNSDYISYVYTNNTKKPSDGPFFINTITNAVPVVDFDNTCILHVMSQGPSILPFNNPTVRVYSYSTSVAAFGAVLGYVQYWANLLLSNQVDDVTYGVEYETQNVYNLWNLSPFSWTQTLKDWATNSDAFKNYVKYRFVNPT